MLYTHHPESIVPDFAGKSPSHGEIVAEFLLPEVE
jgi:hypothetical protein